LRLAHSTLASSNAILICAAGSPVNGCASAPSNRLRECVSTYHDAK
jgi:hypothetical protein